MINNAWKINDGNKTYAKGWSNEEEGGSKGKTFGSQKGSIAGASRPQTSGYRNSPQKQGGYSSQPNTGAYGSAPTQKVASAAQSQYGGSSRSKAGGVGPAVERLRQKLAARGARGFIGMQRQFKIMDDNNSGTIDMNEFRKAVKDFRLELND